MAEKWLSNKEHQTAAYNLKQVTDKYSSYYPRESIPAGLFDVTKYSDHMLSSGEVQTIVYNLHQISKKYAPPSSDIYDTLWDSYQQRRKKAELEELIRKSRYSDVSSNEKSSNDSIAPGLMAVILLFVLVGVPFFLWLITQLI